MIRTILLGIVGLVMLVPVGSDSVYADTEQSQEAMLFSTVGFQSGVINEVQGSTIRIDGRTYVLKATVVVVTHKGQPLELERIIPTSLVKFHLKEGHIDKMMVTLPQ
ncbi:MAG: hypothetical protein JNL86_03340 [Nitrospira sp.]|nr:hypothetical protein [Nitrospira sp.]MCC7470811.1 hypothetical protein [Candidatus Nomurabacteria bacterium]